MTFLWNELTILWNDLTIDWNDLTWNDLTMERNDRKSLNNSGPSINRFPLTEMFKIIAPFWCEKIYNHPQQLSEEIRYMN